MESSVSSSQLEDEIVEPLSPGSPAKEALPRFSVKVSHDQTNVNRVKYCLRVVQNSDKRPHDFIVTRQYEDFTILHRLLVGNCPIRGVVVPPLPLSPKVESSNILQESAYRSLKDCKALETYLKMVCHHWSFGHDELLDRFLGQEELDEDLRPKKGFLDRWSSSFEFTSKRSAREIDEYFVKATEKNNQCLKQYSEVAETYKQVVAVKRKVSHNLGHFATCLGMGSSSQDSNSYAINRIFLKFGEVFDDVIKHTSISDVKVCDSQLGFGLGFQLRLEEAVKDSLVDRLDVLAAYVDSGKALEKARPHQKEAAATSHSCSERSYDDCCEVTRREYVSSKETRLQVLRDALVCHAEQQIAVGQEAIALLLKSINDIKCDSFLPFIDNPSQCDQSS